MSAPVPERKVKCPTCKKEIIYSLQNPYRPFCSDRCKLIDLGDWAQEKFKLPTEESIMIDENSEMEKDLDSEDENP